MGYVSHLKCVTGTESLLGTGKLTIGDSNNVYIFNTVPVREGRLVGLRVPDGDPVPVKQFKGDFGGRLD
jgi:hypothetical protein